MKREIKLSIEGIGSFEGVWTPSNTPTPPDHRNHQHRQHLLTHRNHRHRQHLRVMSL